MPLTANEAIGYFQCTMTRRTSNATNKMIMITQDEIQALEAIYGEQFQQNGDSISITHSTPLGPVHLVVPFNQRDSLVYLILSDWPIESAGPGVYYSIPSDILEIVRIEFKRIVSEAEGEPHIYAWMEYLREMLDSYDYSLITVDHGSSVDGDLAVVACEDTNLEYDSEEQIDTRISSNSASKIAIYTAQQIINEKKSVFQGHCAVVRSVDEVKEVIQSLLKDKKIGNSSLVSSYHF